MLQSCTSSSTSASTAHGLRGPCVGNLCQSCTQSCALRGTMRQGLSLAVVGSSELSRLASACTPRKEAHRRAWPERGLVKGSSGCSAPCIAAAYAAQPSNRWPRWRCRSSSRKARPLASLCTFTRDSWADDHQLNRLLVVRCSRLNPAGSPAVRLRRHAQQSLTMHL